MFAGKDRGDKGRGGEKGGDGRDRRAGGIPEVKGDPLSPRRRYTVLGKDNLTNAEWRVAGPESRFFKVRVDLP